MALMAGESGATPTRDATVVPATPPPRSAHALHYRFSTSLFGRRFYMAILAGTETRSARRLRDEGIVRSFWAVATELSILCLALAMMICLLTGFAVIAVYLAKCAMGIDLMDGPSPLHPIYEFLFGH
jgi:hypothetical protein